MSVNEQAAPAPLGSDEATLHQLGYAQELMRRMSGFSNFAVSFTIISILSGCLTLYGFGMNTGGPVVIVWGWPIVGVMTLLVGLAMAEVCSSFPTAGGLYYWSAKLAPKNGPAWSWFTGWFNFLGQVAVTAGIDFGCAFFITAFLDLQWNFGATPGHIILVYFVVLLLHGVLNQFGVRLVALLNDVSVWWHIVGVLLIVGVLAIVPAHHQSAELRVRALRQQHRLEQLVLRGPARPAARPVHVHRLRRLRAHDRGDPRRGPQRPARHRDVDRGLADRRLGAADRRHVRDPELRGRGGLGHRGAAGPDLHRRGRPTTGKLLLLIAIGAQLFCGMSSVTANSRMIYAFSRDGALPVSEFWHRVNKRTRTPTNAIWLAAAGAFILGLPYLWNTTAYAAVTSIAVIGLYIAYVMPTFLRLRQGDNFQRGPWHLGRWSELIGIDRGDLGRLHHDPVHAAHGQPDHREQLQLHDRRGGGRARLRGDLLAGVGAQVVHRPAGPGHG